MGAGRGGLGFAIATAFQGVDLTVVERSAVRRKAENRLRGPRNASTPKGSGIPGGDAAPRIYRARIDIRDLNMAKLPRLHSAGKPAVVVAKHLCGVATDLALRALLTLVGPEEEKEEEELPTPLEEATHPGDGEGTSAQSAVVPVEAEGPGPCLQEQGKGGQVSLVDRGDQAQTGEAAAAAPPEEVSPAAP
ncbi:unnamed protein product, partial [Discosporangium mesarthrocarpum]